MVVWTVRVVTESCYTYVWAYSYPPTEDSIIKRLMDLEGFDYDDPEYGYDWFVDNTGIYIEETDLIVD